MGGEEARRKGQPCPRRPLALLLQTRVEGRTADDRGRGRERADRGDLRHRTIPHARPFRVNAWHPEQMVVDVTRLSLDLVAMGSSDGICLAV